MTARGLVPGSFSSYGDRYSEYDDGRHLFFSDDADYVRSFGDVGDVVVLRFPWPVDAKSDQNRYGRILGHQFVSRLAISPDQIEMEKADGWWEPLFVPRSRRNPLRRKKGLVSYSSRSSISVGDPGLSPLEATFALGALLLLAGGVTYLWLKPSTPAAPGAQPVPLPGPVQPVPVDPSQPGF